MNVYDQLLKETAYARRSYSVNLVYQTYGKVCMAYDLHAITKDEYLNLNNLLVRDSINNGEWRNHARD